VAVGHRVASGEGDLADGVAAAELAPGLGVPGWLGGLAYDRPRRPRRTGAAAHPRLLRVAKPCWTPRAARYLWESPSYPHYNVPIEDVDVRVLVDGDHARRRQHGTTRRHACTSAYWPGSATRCIPTWRGPTSSPPGSCADRRPRGVLQRAGRRERRRRAPAAADDALLPIGAVAHSGSARRELVLGDRVLEVVRERVRAPRPDVGEDRVVEALLELRAHRLAVGDRQQHR
jgi:hypothetical protein